MTAQRRVRQSVQTSMAAPTAARRHRLAVVAAAFALSALATAAAQEQRSDPATDSNVLVLTPTDTASDPVGPEPAAVADTQTPTHTPKATLTREIIDDGKAVHLFHARDDLLEVEAVYPVLPGDAPSIARANAVIAAAFSAAAETFLAEYDAMLANNGGEHIGSPWSFSLGYQGVHITDTLIAVDGGGYRYSGGAHGGALYLPLVLERDAGAALAPAKLFRPDSDWLDVLARYCRTALAEREPFRDERDAPSAESPDDWLLDGTAPTADNYGLLLPLNDGIRVTFGHYQIGAYAIGDFHVTVPYAELRTQLNPALFPGHAATE